MRVDAGGESTNQTNVSQSSATKTRQLSIGFLYSNQEKLNTTNII